MAIKSCKEESLKPVYIYHISKKVLFDTSLTINDIRIYMIINSFMQSTGSAYPSNNWIARELNIDRRSAIRCLNKLIEKKYIVREEVEGKRYLVINYSRMLDEVVVPTLPPSDTDVTPPSDTDVTLLNINNININKDLKTLTHSANAGESFTSTFASPSLPKKKPQRHYKDDPLFMKFYSAYPRKKDPAPAYLAFLKLKPTKDFVEMLVEDIQARRNGDWLHRDASKVPYPATYLSKHTWEGEIDVAHVANVKAMTNQTSQHAIYQPSGGAWLEDLDLGR